MKNGENEREGEGRGEGGGVGWGWGRDGEKYDVDQRIKREERKDNSK